MTKIVDVVENISISELSCIFVISFPVKQEIFSNFIKSGGEFPPTQKTTLVTETGWVSSQPKSATNLLWGKLPPIIQGGWGRSSLGHFCFSKWVLAFHPEGHRQFMEEGVPNDSVCWRKCYAHAVLHAGPWEL